MKRCILALLIMVYNCESYPTTEPGASSGKEDDSSKKIIGSSVVTSVSVVLNGNKPQFTDAVGNTIPKPLVPLQVASPINLLNPDRYEFYTFNDNGELVKRLMTLAEIQSIVANGNGDGAVIHSFPINDRDPEKNVHDIVESVQKVLNKEVAWKKNLTSEHLVLDTPDVSSSWSMILPAIFGNTGTDIFPNRPQQVAMTLDSEVFTRTPVPQGSRPKDPAPSKINYLTDNEAQNTNIENNFIVKPTFNRPELPSPIASSESNIVATSTGTPATITTVKINSTTSAPVKNTTTKQTTAKTPTLTSRITTVSPKISTEYPLTTTRFTGTSPSKNSAPTQLPTVQTLSSKAPQYQIPMTAVDINYGSESKFSELNHYQEPLVPTGTLDDSSTESLTEASTVNYLSPNLNQQGPIKEDINTKMSIDQILESLTNGINTEKIGIETGTKQYTTIEPTLYNGQLPQLHKQQDILVYTSEGDSYTTNDPEQKVELSQINLENEDESNEHFPPLYANVKEPLLTLTSLTPHTIAESTTHSYLSGDPTTILIQQSDAGNNEQLQLNPVDIDKKPLSIVETIDRLIVNRNDQTSNINYDLSNLEHPVKVSTSNSEINMDDYIQNAATVASNLEGNSVVKSTTQFGETATNTEPEQINDISNIIRDEVNQAAKVPQIQYNSDMANRVSYLANLNPNLQMPNKENIYSSKQDHLNKEQIVVFTTTMKAEIPVTHTRFNLRPTYQSHTKNITETPSEITTQTEPNSSIEINTPHYVKINSIKAAAFLTTEPNTPTRISSTFMMPTTMLPTKTTESSYSTMNDEGNNEKQTEYTDELTNEPTTSISDINTDVTSSHETEQAYVKLGESTETIDSILPTTMKQVTFPETDLLNRPEALTTTIPVKESHFNTLKPVHYYKHPVSNTDQKLIQFNHQRPMERPPALTNLKVTSVGQPPRIHVKLDPTPGQALGLKSSTIGEDKDVLAFAQLCNELAFNYWKSITAEKISSVRSLVISPFALTSMLSMVFLGARGGTSGEMNEILKLDDMVTFNPHLVFKNITDSVGKVRDSHISAAAFIREIYTDRANGKVLQFFKEKVQQFYSGHVEEVNFNIVSDIIRRRTNLLMKRSSAGKVTEYLRTNSVWVNGPFATISANLLQTDCSRGSIFDRDGEMFFQVHPSVRQRRLVPIPAVVWRSGFTAGYDSEVDATVVAFGNALDIISTIYVMPGQQGLAAPGDNLERLENSLIETEIGTNIWDRLLSSLSERSGLEVQLPRFSHRSFINASAGLQRMGLRSIFNSEDADLRGLTGSVSRDVYLSDMIQVNTFTTCAEGRIGDQHHVEMYPAPPLRRKHSGPNSQEARNNVQDSGRALYDHLLDPKYLEVPLQLRPRQARIPDAPRLRFDKPFLYFVRHNPTGMILFMGRFNPRLLP